MKEKMGLKGHWTIEVRDNGKLVKRLDFDNQLTNLYRNSVLNQLYGNTFDSLEIKYLGIGTGDTPASATDTQLGTEVFRVIPTSQTIVDNYVQTIWVIPTQIGNFTYKEIGVFCGTATTTLNSGTMISRVNVNIEKTSSMEITFIRRDYVII